MTIKIRIRTDKNGRRIAHYFGTALRWLPLPIDMADAAIKAGTIFGKPAVQADA